MEVFDVDFTNPLVVLVVVVVALVLTVAGSGGGAVSVVVVVVADRPCSGGRERATDADDAVVSVVVAENGIRPSLPMLWKLPTPPPLFKPEAAVAAEPAVTA